MSNPQDSARSDILVEAVSSVSKANEELSLRDPEPPTGDTQLEALRLEAAFLTQKLADLKLRAQNADLFVAKMRRLMTRMRNEHSERFEALRTRSLQRNNALAETIPTLEQQLEERTMKLKELETAIRAEESLNKRLRAENAQHLAHLAESRLPDASLSFAGVDELKSRSAAHLGLLKVLYPSLADEDNASKTTRSSEDETADHKYQDQSTESDSPTNSQHV